MRLLVVVVMTLMCLAACGPTAPPTTDVSGAGAFASDPCALPASLVSIFPGLGTSTRTQLDDTGLPGSLGCRYTAPDQSTALTVRHYPLTQPQTDVARMTYNLLRKGLNPQERQYVTVQNLPRSGAKETITSTQAARTTAAQVICQTSNRFVTVNYGSRDVSVTPPQFVDSMDQLAYANGCRPGTP